MTDKEKKIYKIPYENNITNCISDIEFDLAFKILNNYLVIDKLYSKIQVNTIDKSKKRIDLHYRLIPSTDKMYNTINNAGTPATYSKKDKGKEICVSKILQDFKMNNDFLERCNCDGYKEILITRDRIENIINNRISKKYQAIILYYAYSGERLPRGLRKYINENSDYRTLKGRLNKAIRTLIEILISEEI